MSEFKDDDIFAANKPVAGAATTDAAPSAGGMTLDLTEADLSDGNFKDIPVGTWLKVKVYEVTPKECKSDKNFGKPQYTFVFHNTEETKEWGERRKFNVFSNLFSGAFFTAYAVFKGLGVQPTKEAMAKGAFFRASALDEYPQFREYLTEDKKIPKGAYVFPTPSEMTDKIVWAKVTGPSNKKKAEKIEAGDRIFPELGEFMSVEDYETQQAKVGESASVFKGE